jgi:arylsulfatase A-like enzyme
MWWVWASPGPNVLLITVDAVRPDYLSCYGGPVAVPTLDWLAAEGVLFEDVTTDVPWVTPALATIHTGVDASRHRVRIPEQRLGDALDTFAQRFQSQGWATGAVVGEFGADEVTALSRGFAYYEDTYNAPMVSPPARGARIPATRFDDLDVARVYHDRKARADSYRTDSAVTDAAIGWLKRQGLRRFLLWVHYFGPHERRREPGDVGGDLPALLREYPLHLAGVDAEIGRLVAALEERGWLNRTVIAVVGVHGQSLMEHNYAGHGANVYQPSLRVPWVMRFPRRLPAGQRLPEMVRTVDVFPTIAAIVGVPLPTTLMGRNVLAPEPRPVAAEAYAETFLPTTAVLSTTVPFAGKPVRVGFARRALRRAEWKLIRNEPTRLSDSKSPPAVPDAVTRQYTSEELYDLARDPRETQNLIAQQRDVAERLRAALAAHIAAAAGGES